MVGPEDEISAYSGADRNLRAPGADREQVIDALKTAFVHGRLAKDEFDLRVGKVIAAYAELDALTADLPAGRVTAQPPEAVRKSHNKKLIRRGTAAGAGASVLLATVVAVAARGNPVASVVILSMLGGVVALLVAGLLTGISWILEQGTGRPRSHRPAGPGGEASQRLTSAEAAGPPSRIGCDPPHTTAAARHRLSDLPAPELQPPYRWRIAYAQAINPPGR